jgi:hypothetical protein
MIFLHFHGASLHHSRRKNAGQMSLFACLTVVCSSPLSTPSPNIYVQYLRWRCQLRGGGEGHNSLPNGPHPSTIGRLEMCDFLMTTFFIFAFFLCYTRTHIIFCVLIILLKFFFVSHKKYFIVVYLVFFSCLYIFVKFRTYNTF